MSDIEKLAALADKADALLELRDQVCALQSELDDIKAQGHRALTTKEAADLLGVTSATVVAWVNKGMIPALMSRNGYRIPAHKIFSIAEREAEQRAAHSSSVTQLV